MSYVLDAGRSDHGMDPLSMRYFNHKTIDYNEVTGSGKSRITFDCVDVSKAAEYAAEDADVHAAAVACAEAAPRRRPHDQRLRDAGAADGVGAGAMEGRGISIDRATLARLSGEFAKEAASLEEDIQKLAGVPLNPGSPKQLGDILFGQLGLPGGTKTKTGQWSTGAKALEDLAEQGHKLPQKILDWRQVSKLRSTYTDALPNYVNPKTQRVHTSYALAATTTGRLSSSEPNLQNIPIRTEEGRKIRRAFIAAPGNKLVSADYSQIELRLLAEVADVPALRKAFQDGVDIHAMTASEMFGVPVKDMPGEVRRRAKAINFGIIYGISAFGLANQLGIEREEAGAYIKKYFERFPGIRDYMDETREFCRDQRLCDDAVRPQVPLPRHPPLQPVAARLQRARRDQCAPAGLGRRHHPPRHGPHGGCARGGEALGADAAAGARRTDLRGERRRSREDLAGRQARDGGCAASGRAACTCRCRSRRARRTTGTRRIDSKTSLSQPALILRSPRSGRLEGRGRPHPSRRIASQCSSG